MQLPFLLRAKNGGGISPPVASAAQLPFLLSSENGGDLTSCDFRSGESGRAQSDRRSENLYALSAFYIGTPDFSMFTPVTD